MRRAAIVGVALVLVAGLVFVAGRWLGWFVSPTVDDATGVDVPSSAVRTVASGLAVPWGVAFLPDGSALVTERDTTRVLAVAVGGEVREVQRVSEARPAGEGGLLGIAVAPTYATDRWVYVYYTTAVDNRIARFRLGEQPQPIVTGIPRAGNHNGGRIAFGPDGMLYAGTGDAARTERSQDRANLGGKILRMTPEGKPAPGNPFGDSLVWSLGHRNVQGLAWDSGGQLYASEFGQNRYDELNRIEAGKNYGWPDVEGAGGADGAGRFVEPVATWSTGDASPSGIAIAGDRVYLACLRGTKLYRIGRDGSEPAVLFDGQFGRLRDAAVAPDGTLWLLTSNRDRRGSPSDDDDRILAFSPGRS
jgi:glucose/arabinose dehydrogenase